MSDVSSNTITEKKFVMAVSADDYSRVYRMAKRAGLKGVVIKGKSGVARFYIRRKVLWADEVKADGSVLTQEVMDINNIPRNEEYRDSMKERLRKDYPDKDEEWLTSHADVLDEANRATKRLIMEGVSPDVAGRIIAEALRNHIGAETTENKPE
jgi:hypothetical protein